MFAQLIVIANCSCFHVYAHEPRPILFLAMFHLYSVSNLQGMMFGYATDETKELMPLSIILAHKLNRKMAELRRNGELPWARPDSKSQVSKFTCIH